jgi:hypothetical protein
MKKLYFTLIFIVFHLFALGQTPTGNSTEVGITDGQLSVSLTGGATYAVPIAVPPGINGVVPQVGLTYNSQGGNGLAGYGWNISGVSTITRIPAAKFHDGKIDAVDFNSMDRFAFDGQRLVVKNGTSTYGADGTVYETENFSNVKITSYGVHPSGANYGPSYFIVEYPDGSKAYYGSTTNSRSITDWAIEYWENPQGVRISYSYALANNSLRIASIKYGTTYATAGINEIQFKYRLGGRQRPEQAYIAGQSIVNDQILEGINVFGNGIGFRNYVLVHDVTSLGYERLISITEKSGDGTKSYNPTLFTYGSSSNSITYYPISVSGASSVGSHNTASISGDFDGDGSMDFALYPTDIATKNKFTVYRNLDSQLNTGVGSVANTGLFLDVFTSTWLTADKKVSPINGITTVSAVTDPAGNISFKTYMYDLSGVVLNYSKIVNFPKTSIAQGCTTPGVTGGSNCGTKFSAPDYMYGKKYLSGDFNGDGLTDVIAIDNTSMQNIGCNYCYPGATNCNLNTCYNSDIYRLFN